MAIIFVDPVGQYATGDLTELWTQAYDTPSGTAVMPTVDTTGSRRSGRCLLFDTTSGTPRTLSKTLAVSGTTGYYGFAFKASGNFSNLRTLSAGSGDSIWPGAGFISTEVPINAIAAFRNLHYTQVALSINTNGTLAAILGDAATITGLSGIDSPITTVTGATSTRALLTDQWYFIEWELTTHASAGTCKVYVNEELWINVTGVQTTANNGGAAGLTEICLGQLRVSSSPAGGLQWRYHDIRLIDTNTSDQDNDLAATQGDLAIEVVSPTADGAMVDWTPNSGVTHYTRVDEIPPNDDTDYNQSSTANQIDTFATGGVPIAGATIVSAGVMYSARRVNSGPSKTQPVFRIGGTNYTIGSEIGNTSTYSYHQAFVNKKPSNHVAWSAAEFAAAEPGYKKTA